jgi:hypothetical protein
MVKPTVKVRLFLQNYNNKTKIDLGDQPLCPWNCLKDGNNDIPVYFWKYDYNAITCSGSYD